MKTRGAIIVLVTLLSIGSVAHAADVCTGTIIPEEVVGHMSPGELEVLDLLNDARAPWATPPILAVSCRLTQAAQAQSAKMLAEGSWSHSGVNDEIVVNTNGVGADLPARAVDWWMDSGVHRSIILGYAHPYVGIGQACNAARTACYWTAQFTRDAPAAGCGPWPGGSSPPTSPPPPTPTPTGADLVVVEMYNPPASVTAGASFGVRDYVLNQGTANAGTSTSRYYLAVGATRSAQDILLAGARIVAELQPGQIGKGSLNVTVPASTPRGSYYLLACADDLGQVGEGNEGNNCRASTTKIQVQWCPTRVAERSSDAAVSWLDGRDSIFRGCLEGTLPGSYGENSVMSSVQRAGIAWKSEEISREPRKF
jgi:CARDB/Cysteine-rich secretory protein family